jgi:hypothetical protein
VGGAWGGKSEDPALSATATPSNTKPEAQALGPIAFVSFRQGSVVSSLSESQPGFKAICQILEKGLKLYDKERSKK